MDRHYFWLGTAGRQGRKRQEYLSANEEDPAHGEKEESIEGIRISSTFPVEVGRSQLRSAGGKPRRNSIRKTGS